VIEYDRENWWRTCLAWRGTVLPYILPRVGLLTGLCLAWYLFDVIVFHPQGRPLPALDPLGHTVLGVALGMLIVFRTNNSNTRYWEARSHWGMLVNASRNLVRAAAAYAGPADDLARMATAYVILVKEQLRNRRDPEVVAHLLPGRLLLRLRGANNPAQLLAAAMSEWVASRVREGVLSPILGSRLETLIGTLIENQGGCEKIHRTPLPFVYASLIKQVLLVYLATLPFALVNKMAFMAPLVVMGVSAGMLGIEEAGVEIEDPFGLDDNHLPLDALCETIGRDLHDLTTADKTH
jgi:putative membrane protein